MYTYLPTYICDRVSESNIMLILSYRQCADRRIILIHFKLIVQSRDPTVKPFTSRNIGVSKAPMTVIYIVWFMVSMVAAMYMD